MEKKKDGGVSELQIKLDNFLVKIDDVLEKENITTKKTNKGFEELVETIIKVVGNAD